MQELNQYKDLPNTTEEDEAMKELFEKMGQDLTAQHAPIPQPSGEFPHNPDITSTINNICLQLHALFTTVIGQQQANTTQPDTTPPEPLQETIELLLKQSDWFKEMVRSAVEDAFDIEDYAKEAVEDVVESKVDSYFNSSFDASDHFDFSDAVSDCVSDQIHDAVSDKIDGAVEEYMSNATITIQRS